MSVFFSMAAFALASSISPGPVNIVALTSGAKYGLSATLKHVSGATTGFTLLLILMGFGLHQLLLYWPGLISFIQWFGVAFLLFMAYKLAVDNGRIGEVEGGTAPSWLYGAIMQWLNPKAWLAIIAGIGVFVSEGERGLIWQFAAIYFVICFGSIACWAIAGVFLRQYLHKPKYMRLFNRLMALLLVGCAAYFIQ